MYAKLCDMEILSSYVSEVSVGDLLTVQALVTNPLDWQHFYEKISTVKKGDKTDFMVVTQEGDRLQGAGDIVEVERWSNLNRYGFKVKISVKKQKSLTDRRIRLSRKTPLQSHVPVAKKKIEATTSTPDAVSPVAVATTMAPFSIKKEEIMAFRDMLKDSLAMDMTSDAAAASSSST